MDSLQRVLLEAREKEERDKKIEVLIRILSTLYDKAVGYTNLVIIAGYAAFFTVWSIMKNQLSHSEMLVSAFCITFSLIVFVSWETLKMIITSTYFTGLHRVLEGPPEQFDARLAKQQESERKLNIRLLRIWIVILLLTVVPGLIAGGVLLFSFARQLFWV